MRSSTWLGLGVGLGLGLGLGLGSGLGLGLGLTRSSHAQVAAALHVAALRVLAPLRPTALARLAYGSLLLPCLWSLLCRLPSGGGGQATSHKAAGTSGAPTPASDAKP